MSILTIKGNVRFLISNCQCNKRSITPNNSKQEKLSQAFTDANLLIIFLLAKHLHTNVNCDHSVKTMYNIIPSKIDQHANIGIAPFSITLI